MTSIKLDRERHLRYGMRAIAQLERHFDCKMSQLSLDMDNMGIDDVVAVVHAGLLHEDKEITQDEVLDMLDEKDNIGEVFEAIGKAFETSFGTAEGKNQKPAAKKKPR